MPWPHVTGEYKFDSPLRHLTWFKVGGNAELLYKPSASSDLQLFLRELQPNIPIFVLGAGSNTLIRDGGIKGVVIKLGRAFTDITIDNEILYCGAGSLNFNIARFAAEHGLSGMEFLVGIPGTIGGGVWMNAGCYGSEFKDILHEVHLVTREGELVVIPASECQFGYRKSFFPVGAIIVGASFRLCSKDTAGINSKMEEITNLRKATQPQGCKTGGSTFANPAGAKKAWQLIEEAGLREVKIGGASFSQQHCNFMINDGTASAADLEDLGELTIKRVKETSGADLHWEIARIGEKK